MRLAGKVAVVTGAASGLGEAIARRFAAEGATVFVSDIDAERGEWVAAELGKSSIFLSLDVSEARAWASAMASIEHHAGALHILVNNAARYIRASLQESTEADFDAQVSINQRGVFLGMRSAAPLMARAGGGSIVNVSSSGGLRGGAGMFIYRGTKWAVRGLTRSAAHDLASAGIRVNSVHPGPMATAMFQSGGKRRSASIVESTLLKRAGSPGEIANAVLFLASDEASYITGSELVVDGGLCA